MVATEFVAGVSNYAGVLVFIFLQRDTFPMPSSTVLVACLSCFLLLLPLVVLFPFGSPILVVLSSLFVAIEFVAGISDCAVAFVF